MIMGRDVAWPSSYPPLADVSLLFLFYLIRFGGRQHANTALLSNAELVFFKAPSS
jgi:hypothetical protein